ncbi:hypothetical protein N7613_01015 [Pseudomonas juntendi]|uniref:hypothetical protein n=1 Tax=Pseudomonas TaxID=286 RepID=UPI0018E693BF|nr:MULTISPECIES: hypothetical protein [Pseudomonas]MBI6912452.1 hypothetical protein [Pseudomonas juntendi]MDG9807211.1 hypothetical protein [Pseudomonas juntendi]
MRPIAVFWACLTSAAFAFLIGVTLAGFAASHRITQAEDQHQPPPAGDQFDEGPVLARLPAPQLSPVRFIF